MSPAELFRRAVALLVAIGLFAVSMASVSADNGDEETAVVAAVQSAQLTAEIPDGYEVLFPLEWGGGSLRRLIGKLAGRGCALDILWVHDRGEWNPYSRYEVSPDFPVNQQFIQRYEQDVPAGTLYATCGDQPIAQDLQPSQIVADVPEEYDTMFELHWGGGSLLHFKGRLATMGCIVNNISFTDPNTGREHTYNQYNTNSTNKTNQQFLTTFEQFLPAGVFSVDCYDVCKFKIDQKCISLEEMRGLGDSNYADTVYPTGGLPCTIDFHPKVISNVFNILPVAPDLCIIRREEYVQRTWGRSISGDQSIPSFIIIFKHLNHIDALHTEIHEICHINQYWHWVQQLKSDSQSTYGYSRYFNNSPQGQEFINLIRFIQISFSDWKLSIDNIYRSIYSKIPVELAAELCSMYLLDKMGEQSGYYYYTYSNGNITRLPQKREFDVNTYLTPEIREWLETYMTLPDVSE